MAAPAETEVLKNDCLDLSSLENLTVYDNVGTTISFGSLYKDKKTIFIFVRHFLCYICKEYVDDLAYVPEKSVNDANVRIVVIGCAPWKFIDDFRRLTNYHFEMYCDPERLVYQALHCVDKMKVGNSGESPHVKSGQFSGVMKSIWRTIQSMEMQGNVQQQGASLVIGPGNVVHFIHINANTTDHAPINNLLQAAGIPPVEFHRS